MRLSVKSRLGMFDPEEFHDVLQVYNRYPLSELILHPRVRKEMYKGDPHMDYALYTAKNTGICRLSAAFRIKCSLIKYNLISFFSFFTG